MKSRSAERAETRASEPGLVLDAGALQSLERRHLRLIVDLQRAHALGLPIRIPAGALAQSWRGGPRSASITRLLRQPCIVVHVDERVARDIGEFVANVNPSKRKKPDVVDAHVALVTRATRSLLWTTDPDDMLRYGVDAAFICQI